MKIRPIKSLLEKHPFFLLTLPFIFFIQTANHYFQLLNWEYIVADTLIYLLIPVLLYFIIGRLWGSYPKSGVLLFASLYIFYYFHVLYEWLNKFSFLSFVGHYTVLLPLILAGIILLIVYLKKKESRFKSFYYNTNIILILLLAAGIIQYIFQSFNNTPIKHDQANPLKPLVKSYTPCDTCISPDIYFLIFDGYTNTKTLKKEFDYDNHEIEKQLEKKDFFIARHSKSNYNFTHMSLSSELNLDYLLNLNNTHQFYTKDFLQSYYTVYHNELAGILKKQGYTINNYSNFAMQDAPVKITPHLTELTYRSVLGQTFFNKLNRDIGWHLARFYPKNKVSKAKEKKIDDDIKRISEVFNGVIEAAKRPPLKPQFLYGHFLMPHETFYFDSSGNRLSKLFTAQTLVNKKNYRNQLVYTNKFLMAPLVDSIFKYARRPFIVIIQSDHGYRSYEAGKVHLEFENFCAFYFPDKDYSLVSDSISSVNTFRVVLNKYFNQHLPLLKDSLINLSKRNSYLEPF